MLVKPNLEDKKIITCLQEAYGLNASQICFLPIGADFNTAVYKITTNPTNYYFLKLRSNDFNPASVWLPKYLADQGVKQIISPIATKTGGLWTTIESFKAILYPYVDGHNGAETKPSEQHWIELGKTIQKLHNTNIPNAIISEIPQESFSSQWRKAATKFLAQIKTETFKEPICVQLADFLKSQETIIFSLIQQAESLAQALIKQPLEHVVCHADIHGWNLLIDKKDALYLVDWDTLILAPKERDLMFIGAGIWNSGRTSAEEQSLFYQGYGKTNINQSAITYYRCERIIQDISEYCSHILLSDANAKDRQQSLEYLQTNFLPGGTIEKALEQ